MFVAEDLARKIVEYHRNQNNAQRLQSRIRELEAELARVNQIANEAKQSVIQQVGELGFQSLSQQTNDPSQSSSQIYFQELPSEAGYTAPAHHHMQQEDPGVYLERWLTSQGYFPVRGGFKNRADHFSASLQLKNEANGPYLVFPIPTASPQGTDPVF